MSVYACESLNIEFAQELDTKSTPWRHRLRAWWSHIKCKMERHILKSYHFMYDHLTHFDFLLNYSCYCLWMDNFKILIFTARWYSWNECFPCLAVSRVILFSSAPYTVCSCGSTLRSHKYDLLYLSALAANNKMDLVTKAVIFLAVSFFFC